MKRFLSILMILALLLPSAAMADDIAGLRKTWLSKQPYYYDQLSDVHKEAWEHDIDNLLTYPVLEEGEYHPEYRALARMIQADNPRIFWLDWIDDYGCPQYVVKNVDLWGQPMQIENGATLEELKQNFLAGIDKAVAAIRSTLPEKAGTRDKLLAIHDWLCANNTYNDAQTSSHKADSDPVAFAYLAAHSAYSAIIPGDEYEPVCEGYALAFKLLCDEFKIKCICVSGKLNGVNHMWNMVNTGKETWFLVDVMSDDRYDGATYFFMLNKEKASKNTFAPDPYMGSGVKPENGYAAEEGAPFTFPELYSK